MLRSISLVRCMQQIIGFNFVVKSLAERSARRSDYNYPASVSCSRP